MRHDRRFTRVLIMLTEPEVPRTEGGGVKLCHYCQRAVYFADGFLKLLVKDLKIAASDKRRGFTLSSVWSGRRGRSSPSSSQTQTEP